MGANSSSKNGSDARSVRSLTSSASLASMGSARSSSAPPLSAAAAAKATERVRVRIRAFRERAATQDICAQVLSSWLAERDRVHKTWRDLSNPARRSLVMNARERVVSRARALHGVVAPRALSAYNKNKIVRKLMEKAAFELFDVGLLYGTESLPALVESVLQRRGGGNEVPVGLLLEVDNTFEPDDAREHSPTLLSEPAAFPARSPAASPAASDGESEAVFELHDDLAADAGGEAMSDASAAARPPCIELVDATGARGALVIDAASVNSLQGYFSRDQARQARRKSASRSIRNLLAFVPEGLDARTRRDLALELLLEMRHAFLVHFAVLVFSELFDDEQKVLRKYEYDSDSETDGGVEDTDLEEEDDDDDLPCMQQS